MWKVLEGSMWRTSASMGIYHAMGKCSKPLCKIGFLCSDLHWHRMRPISKLAQTSTARLLLLYGNGGNIRWLSTATNLDPVLAEVNIFADSFVN